MDLCNDTFALRTWNVNTLWGRCLIWVRGVERYQQNAVGLNSAHAALALEPNSLIDGGLPSTQVLSRWLWDY